VDPRDIYDDMPDGVAQRDRNKQRLAELEADGASRRARIAEVVAYAELAGPTVLPACPHTP
jgi:transcriptional regulator of nitric oxide reductase